MVRAYPFFQPNKSSIDQFILHIPGISVLARKLEEQARATAMS